MIQHYRKTEGFAGGRSDKMNNLFGHLAVCGRYGYPMTFINTGKTSRHLKCDKPNRNINGGCSLKRIRYDLVEENILIYCKGLNVSDVVPNSEQTVTELSVLQNKSLAINGQLGEIEEKINNLVDNAENTSNEVYRKALEHRAASHLIKRSKLEQEKRDV